MATIKQKQFAQKLVENGGKKSVAKLAEEVGYSENTAHTPKKITGGKGFLDEMEKLCPEKTLAQLQRVQLKAVKEKIMTFKADVDDEMIKKIVKSLGFKLIHIFTNEKELTVGRGKNKRTETIKLDKQVYCSVPLFEYRDRALDKMYKIKGVYSAERHIINDFADLSDEELEEKYNEAVAQKKRYDEAQPKPKSKGE